MRESYIFYLSFYEALKELPDEVRLRLYDMISVYALTGEEMESGGIEKAVFTLIKPQIKANNQRYENGCAGGAPKGNSNAKKKGKTATEKQPKINQEKTEKQPKNNQKQPNENVNVNVNVNDISPLFIPPQGGEKEKTDEDLFFEKYPRYAKDRATARKDFDYRRLLEEFEKSAYLRSLYTLKQVNENYALIVTGEFRDKPNPQADKFADINAKTARARWYSARQQAAQNKADKIHDKFMQLEEFKTIERRLAKIELEAAKESIKAEQGDNKAVKQLVKLEQEKNRLIIQRRNIIEYNGKTEEDLLPQWHCKKCSDTGYLPDGKMCDCYDKRKE